MVLLAGLVVFSAYLVVFSSTWWSDRTGGQTDGFCLFVFYLKNYCLSSLVPTPLTKLLTFATTTSTQPHCLDTTVDSTSETTTFRPQKAITTLLNHSEQSHYSMARHRSCSSASSYSDGTSDTPSDAVALHPRRHRRKRSPDERKKSEKRYGLVILEKLA